MPREKIEFRDMLERLDQAFPGRELLMKKEIAAWAGCQVSTLNNRYGWPRGLVPKVRVARDMATQ